jgi:hypothetical protein
MADRQGFEPGWSELRLTMGDHEAFDLGWEVLD